MVTSSVLGTSRRSRALRAAFAGSVIAAATALLMPARASAAPGICAASLNVDVHYCLQDPPDPILAAGGVNCPSTTDTLALQVGDVVTLTLEVRNDSQYQNPPLMGVPKGHLQTGATFDIAYACSASTCNPGEIMPGVFQFNGATVIGDAAGPPLHAAFADHANGTGTLTITSTIDPAPLVEPKAYLVQLKLTVLAKPPVPPSDGMTIFARGEANPTALLIDDPLCLPGLTGTGEGSTSALFAAPPPLQPCAHPNKQTIKIDEFPNDLEETINNVAFQLPGYDPSANALVFGYQNANGLVDSASWTVPAGGFLLKTTKPSGLRVFDYTTPPAACTNGVPGILQATLYEYANDKWCLRNFKACEDLEAGQNPLPMDHVMWMFITTGGKTFQGPNTHTDPPYLKDATWKMFPLNAPFPGKQWQLPLTAWKK